MEDLVPASHTTNAPFVKKMEYQCIDINDEFLTLLTDSGDTRDDIKLPKFLNQAPPVLARCRTASRRCWARRRSSTPSCCARAARRSSLTRRSLSAARRQRVPRDTRTWATLLCLLRLAERACVRSALCTAGGFLVGTIVWACRGVEGGGYGFASACLGQRRGGGGHQVPVD